MSSQPHWSDLLAADSRAAAKIEVADDGCWIWTGARTGSGGYGHLSRSGRNVRAHRHVYNLLVGPIPEGLVLDHLCRVHNCVNPTHLEVVTVGENTRRGTGPVARNAVKTHCASGHAFDELNTYRYSRGRRCRTCNTEAKRREREGRAA